ncbi:flippase [Robertkochia sediminum]|uniref:flippase n=1 Tax=Robertkochia sediminum TaxID=2785326 RepID=UPI0019312E1F|nr:flippase [Robertkochia sediminum]MBL7473729.1 flippase [Robertkochia sediminum]
MKTSLRHLNFLSNKSGFIRYLSNTSWLAGEKVVRLLVALLVGIWVTRYLGPEDFGILSYAQSFVALFVAFSSFGLKDILVRELVKSKDKNDLLLGTAFGLQTLGSVIIMSILLVAILLNDNEAITNKIIIILGLVSFLHSFGVINSFFVSRVQSKYVAVSSLVALLISSGIKLLLIYYEAPLLWFVYAIAFEVVLVTIGLIVAYHKTGYAVSQWRLSRTLGLELVKESWPVILSGIMISIYMKVDQVMIKELMDNASVGQYAAAARLSEAWYFIPMIVCASLFPALVNAREKSESLYHSRLQRLYDLMVIMGLAVVLPVVSLSEWGIVFLYGEAFLPSAAVLDIHIWSGLFVFLGVANGKWLINENLQRYHLVFVSLGMLVNVGLNLVLIPTMGILGAAWATLISQAVSAVLASSIFPQTRPSFFRMLKAITFVSIVGRVVGRR